MLNWFVILWKIKCFCQPPLKAWSTPWWNWLLIWWTFAEILCAICIDLPYVCTGKGCSNSFKEQDLSTKRFSIFNKYLTTTRYKKNLESCEWWWITADFEFLLGFFVWNWFLPFQWIFQFRDERMRRREGMHFELISSLNNNPSFFFLKYFSLTFFPLKQILINNQISCPSGIA